MIIINKKTILASIAAILIISSALPRVCFVAQAQTDTTFYPTDKFDIPTYNSTISFATGGTYASAGLENGTWNFVNLNLNYSGQLENLSVSAKDSNLTITSYQVFDATNFIALLTYTVVGYGEQTFNLGLSTAGGEWSVTFNGNFISENEGWRVLPDETITITGAPSNVTIFYFVFPDDLSPDGSSSNQSVYQQHSVAIATAVVIVAAVVTAVMIRRRNQDK